MRSRLRLRWLPTRRLLVIIGLIVAILVVIALIFLDVRSYGTGFTGKTLWDWFQLLIIPVVLAIAALLFNLATTRTEQRIALDRQREDLLQKYLDCMSDLMLKEGLRSSAVDSEVRNFARVRTITLLFQLDARRIGLVVSFLREAKLMSITSDGSVVNLKNADLSKIDFSQANLRQADLREADLFKANLSGATLTGANLSGASLSWANLSGAILQNTNLSRTNLRGANLSYAVFYEANLSEADLTETDLSNAYLREADLTGAKVTEEQLEKATWLKDTTMPDGSKHP